VEDARDPLALMYHSFRLLGAPAGGYGPPLSGISQGRQSVSAGVLVEGEAQWDRLPAGLQEGIRNYIGVWAQSAQVLQQFTAPFMEDLKPAGCPGNQTTDLLMEPWIEKQLYSFTSVDMIRKADLRKLSFASRLLAGSLKELMHLYPLEVGEDFTGCVLETALGDIGIFGPANDTITSGFSLIIDLGGDDLYTGPIASTNLENPISVLVDFSGNDNYRPVDGQLACARTGIGLLVDLEGDDQYQSDHQGLAAACYGTALLFDRKGDDRYISTSGFSQGAAHLGVAMLVDLSGNDRYNCAGSSQGYGGTMGIGLLLDLSGDDRYNLENPDNSFVQGAGRGRWAQFSDGHSLGGGLGLFVEAGGDDRYWAGSFSQGASYFTGTGIFTDLEGDDQYHARSHAQGFAAHFACSGFFEIRGDDHYNAGSEHGQITQLLGNGRDLSAACFVDERGDDTYHLGNRSGGIGDLHGIGFMWDWKGHDSLIWHQNTVNAGSPSLGYSPGLASGMGIGSENRAFPENIPSGWFRADGSFILLEEDKY
jgi:hypothetical protein